MNVAEIMIERARLHGVDVMFANPGTTEMPFVDALAHQPGIRAVLGLHENVCTAAADGYGRMTGRPALTLLHLGPGFANGIANLHNARKAHTPIVNLIGDHATWHLQADAPLTMEIAPLLGTVSCMHGRLRQADDAALLFDRAHLAAMHGRGGVASLIVPHDLQLQPSAVDERPLETATRLPAVACDRIEAAADMLGKVGTRALLIGGLALYGEGLDIAGRIAAETGAHLIGETGFARMSCGQNLPYVERLPYFPEQAQQLLDRFEHVVVCGTRLPVSFFGYGHLPNRYLDARAGVVHLANAEEDAVAALNAVLDLLPRASRTPTGSRHEPNATRTGLERPPDGALTMQSLAALLVRAQPEDAIVVPTAVSGAAAYAALADRASRHTELALTGGAIGSGPGMAIGAAIAQPDAKIINLEADGSLAYLPQALWTQAREGLNIVTIVCANHRYNILQMELQRAGLDRLEGAALDLTDLSRPEISWINVARGFGIDAVRAQTVTELDGALATAMAANGPKFIEAVLP